LAPGVSNHNGRPQRNYELKKSHLLIECPFIWLNNLKFVAYRKSKPFIQSIHFASHFAAARNMPHHTPFPPPPPPATPLLVYNNRF
jgi:hypothetical protein